MSDTAANIATYFNALNSDSKLTSIKASNGLPIPLTYTQYSTDTTALKLLASGTDVSVSAVPVANAATVQAASAVKSFSVTDTAANVLSGLASLSSDSKLSSIVLSGSATLAVTYTQYSSYSATLDKLASGDTMTVSAATAASAATLQGNSVVSGFTVTDTAANIATNLSSLSTATKLTGITVSSGTSMSITYAQYTGDTTLLATLPSTIAYVLSAVPAADAATVQAATAVTSFSVADTSANLVANLAALAASSKLTSFSLSSGTSLTVTYTQYTAYTSLLALLSSSDKLAVSAVTVANAATMQSASKVASFAVTDTAANVLANLATLAKDTKLTAIVLSGGTTLGVTYTQYTTYSKTLALLTSGDTLVVSAVPVADAATIQASALVSAFSVTDSSANILAALASLAADTKLTAFSLSSGTTFAVTWAEYSSYTAMLNLIAGATLSVLGAPVADAAALQSASDISIFRVSDTSANIAAALSALAADSKLAQISLSSGTTLGITYAQYSADGTVLADLSTSDTLVVSATPAAGAAALQAAATVSAFAVSDTSTNVLASLTALAADTKLTSIALTDTSVLPVTATQYFADTATLDLLASGDSMSVSGATVAEAATLQADPHVSAFSVIDTQANLTAGATQLAADTKLTGESVQGGSSGPTVVTYAQYLANQASLDASAGTGGLIVTGVTAAAATTVAADTAVASLTVGDTLADIGVSLDSLQTLVASGQLTGIAVTDSGQNLAVTATQSANDAAALAMMSGNFTVTRPIINLIWDSSVASAPAGFVSAIEDAANWLDATVTNPITINIEIGYGEEDGTTLPVTDVGLSQALSGMAMLPSTYLSDLATSTNNAQVIADIPAVAATAPDYSMEVVGGEAKAIGAMAGYGTEIDGASGFQTDTTGETYTYNPYDRAVAGRLDLVGLAESELTHVFGRISYAGVTTPLDLFRYSAPGVTAASGAASYFSINDGNTGLGTFDTASDPSDWNTASVPGDANDVAPAAGVANLFSALDVTELQALGYAISSHAPSPSAVIPASADGGLNAASLTFIGTPITLTMGTTTTTASLAIPPAGGIEEISSFTYGTDTLSVNLSDLSGTLEAFDTTVGGVHAIALTGSNDLTHGIVLLGMPTADTAANLLSSHITVSSGVATIT